MAISALTRRKELGGIDLSSVAYDPSRKVQTRLLETLAQVAGTCSDAASLAAEVGADNLATLIERATELLDHERMAEEMANELTEVAAFALGEIGALPAATPLVPEVAVARLQELALRHRNSLVREAAVVALGNLGTGEATIIDALADRATIRRRAVIALANFDGPAVEEALASARHDRDEHVRQIAEDLTGDTD